MYISVCDINSWTLRSLTNKLVHFVSWRAVICIDPTDTTVKQINSILIEYYQISQYITVGSVEKEFNTQSNWCYPISAGKWFSIRSPDRRLCGECWWLEMKTTLVQWLKVNQKWERWLSFRSQVGWWEKSKLKKWNKMRIGWEEDWKVDWRGWIDVCLVVQLKIVYDV